METFLSNFLDSHPPSDSAKVLFYKNTRKLELQKYIILKMIQNTFKNM